MAYLALYRKYRPQTFDEVVGQDVVTRTLKNAVASGRTSHAYLFCGPRGTGKTSTAKILARAVNCENPQDGEPCGECRACLALSEANAADIFEFDAASNSRVEQMRDLLDKVMYPPTVGKRRVYILDEVHMLSPAAFNALLKTLEEPPAFAMFILATTEPHRVPATIISRCQRFDFRRIAPETIAARLRSVLDDAGASVSDDAINLIASLSEGGMRDALSLADQVVGMADGNLVTDEDVVRITGGANAQLLRELSAALVSGELGQTLDTLGRAMANGADASQIARDLARYFRDMLVSVSIENPAHLLRRDAQTAAALHELGQKAGSGFLTNALRILLALDGTMRYALSPRVALETALSQIALGAAEDSAAVAALSHKVEQLEQKLSSGAFSAKISREGQVSPTEALAAENFPRRPAPPKKKAFEAPKNFKGLLEVIKRKRMPLYSALVKAQCREDGDRLHILFSKDDKMYAMVVQKKDNFELVQSTAAEVYARPVKVDVQLFESDEFDPAFAEKSARALFGDKLTVE